MYVSELSLVVLILILSRRFKFRLYIHSFYTFRLYFKPLGVPY